MMYCMLSFRVISRFPPIFTRLSQLDAEVLKIVAQDCINIIGSPVYHCLLSESAVTSDDKLDQILVSQDLSCYHYYHHHHCYQYHRLSDNKIITNLIITQDNPC